MELFLVILGAAFLIGIIRVIMKANDRSEIRTEIRSVPSFRPSFEFVGADGKTGIAIEESRKQVVLLRRISGSMSRKTLNYRDIMSVELVEDGVTVTKTSRTSQAGSALVGGLLFGGVGAAVGALTGSSKTTGKIKRVDVRITVNDSSNPVMDLCFQDIEMPAGSHGNRAAREKANEWVGRLNVVIRRADEDDRREAAARVAAQPVPQIATTRSKADELAKLAKLKADGVLTEVEFAAEKAKLLAS